MKKLLTILLTLASFVSFASDEATTLIFAEHNTVILNSPVTFDSVSVTQMKLMEIANLENPPQEIFLVLNTPGGSIHAGNALIDVINSIHIPIHTYTLFSASMGYQIVQANKGKRFIAPTGTLMSHRAALGGLGGQLNGELETRLQNIYNMVERLDKIASSRVGIPLQEYKDLIVNELWISGQAAVDANHADDVRTARCSNSLMGVDSHSIDFFGMKVSYKTSKCPIIYGMFDLKFEKPTDMEDDEFDNLVNKFKLENISGGVVGTQKPFTTY